MKNQSAAVEPRIGDIVRTRSGVALEVKHIYVGANGSQYTLSPLASGVYADGGRCRRATRVTFVESFELHAARTHVLRASFYLSLERWSFRDTALSTADRWLAEAVTRRVDSTDALHEVRAALLAAQTLKVGA